MQCTKYLVGGELVPVCCCIGGFLGGFLLLLPKKRKFLFWTLLFDLKFSSGLLLTLLLLLDGIPVTCVWTFGGWEGLGLGFSSPEPRELPNWDWKAKKSCSNWAWLWVSIANTFWQNSSQLPKYNHSFLFLIKWWLNKYRLLRRMGWKLLHLRRIRRQETDFQRTRGNRQHCCYLSPIGKPSSLWFLT